MLPDGIRHLLMIAMLVPLLALSSCGGNGSGSESRERGDSQQAGTSEKDTPRENSSAPGSAGYPSERITVLVPYTLGGPTDLATRAVADYFEQELGQSVVVENREGASGAFATSELVRSEADGHTIGVVASPATAVVPLMVEDVAYDINDFTTVGGIMEMPTVLAVNSDSPYGSAEEFLDAAESSSGTTTVGTPGVATSQSVELQKLNQDYETQLGIIPFDGNTELTGASLGRNVDAIFTVASESVVSLIESGELEPLAVSSAERVEFFPGVPTLAELGYGELMHSTSTFGLVVPQGTPPDVVGQLEEMTRAAMEEPEVVEQIGEDYVPSDFITGEEFRLNLEETRETYEPTFDDQ